MEASQKSKLTCPSLSLLSAGQPLPGPGHPGAPFFWGFLWKSPATPVQGPAPGSTQQDLGGLQLSHSEVPLWEKEDDKAPFTSCFLREKGLPVTQGPAAGSPPPTSGLLLLPPDGPASPCKPCTLFPTKQGGPRQGK